VFPRCWDIVQAKGNFSTPAYDPRRMPADELVTRPRAAAHAVLGSVGRPINRRLGSGTTTCWRMPRPDLETW